jgi:Xaa-Pro dipeptidase
VSVYAKRREKLYDWMARESIALVIFEDAEKRRDASVRWLSGHPHDAMLFLSVEQKSLLVPWDINQAKLFADVDLAVPYSEFSRHPLMAAAGAAEQFRLPKGSKVEISPATSYPSFLKYVEALDGFDVICRERGIWAETERLRAFKDEEEIGIYRKAAEITNTVIDLLEKHVRSGKIKTEADAAVFIEIEGRKRGCEGTGFETLAAGPERSFGIHAFPPYTGAPFGGKGLSILDFGLKFAGYTTDVTLTFANSPAAAQERLLALTERAYRLGLSMTENGRPAREIAAAVDALFGKSKKTMPHGLGHGIGLEEHENPQVRNRDDNEWILEPGMIFTLEPGLYDPVHGGCRLENDILLTESGPEILTKARIIRL